MAGMIRPAGLLAAWLAVAPAPALAGGAGTVDWEHRVVRCTGAGAPRLGEETGNVAVARVRTERAARRQAARACREALDAIVVQGSDTVGALVGQDAALGAAVEDVLEQARHASVPRFFSDGGAALDVEVPLDGALTELLLRAVAGPAPAPAATGAGAAKPASPGSAAPVARATGSAAAGAAPSAPAPTAGQGAPASGAATGVLIDASASRVTPALAPRVLDPYGQPVASARTLAASARPGGVAAYARDVAAAQRALTARLGSAPVVVKAVGGQGPDVTVSAADAQALRASQGAALAQGKLVIVLPER
jgi:hypothetical protein